MEWRGVADLAHLYLPFGVGSTSTLKPFADSASWFPSMWRNSEVWWLIKRKKLRTCSLMYHGNACPETVGEVNNQPNVFHGPSDFVLFFVEAWSFWHAGHLLIHRQWLPESKLFFQMLPELQNHELFGHDKSWTSHWSQIPQRDILLLVASKVQRSCWGVWRTF